MRELKRLLRLNAGRGLEICIEGHKFELFSLFKDGDDCVRVVDLVAGEAFVSKQWPLVANYISCQSQMDMSVSNSDLYDSVLALSVDAYLNQTQFNEKQKAGLADSLEMLACEEPLIKSLLAKV